MLLNSKYLNEKKISDLIHDDYQYAKVLNSFGIDFYKHYDENLIDLCNIKGISFGKVLGYRNSLHESNLLANEYLKSSPVNLVIEFLKDNHNYFIKNKLPYLQNLINNLNENKYETNFSKDLKFIFPIFFEDFVEHIYEEENDFFNYIYELFNASQGRINPSNLLVMMKKYSIKKILDDHINEDSEMAGIRGITRNYSYKNIKDLHLKVIFQELKEFDEELTVHSYIENNILFPKAFELEKKASKILENIAFHN
tara:strand:- start:2478 stop:3239 length:762 start_codon:yes stop_codon:yes gene_type:complete